ncbi:MAG TPA: hypothetical protein VMX12_00255, partial [Acidimicrobiia bacterium]|nr:hypothetical protein [Acidimicrobiia bacterium]
MPEFEFAEADRERWTSRVEKAVGAAALSVRERMAAALNGSTLPDPDEIYDPAWWDAAMAEHVNGEFYAIGLEAARQFADENNLEVDDGWLTKVAVLIAAGAVLFIGSRSEVIQRRVSDVVDGALDTLDALDTAAEVIDALEADEIGATRTLQQIEADTVRRVARELGVTDGDLSGPISEGIARNVSTGVSTHLSSVAADEVIKKTGATGYKIWNCLFINSRDSHKNADGQKVAVDEMFKVGKSKGRYPGDPDLPVEEVANCNCWLTYEVEPAEKVKVGAFAEMGGPGSGPRPGVQSPWYRRGSKKDEPPIRAPGFEVFERLNDGGPRSHAFTGEAKAALQASERDWERVVGYDREELTSQPGGGGREEAMKARGLLKAEVVKAVSGRMHDDPEFQAWAVKAGRVDADDPTRVPRSVSEGYAERYLDSWANSAADHDPGALALQRAAKVEFRLKNDAHTAGAGGVQEKKIYADQGPAMRAFVRAQYAETQAVLSANGITEMTLSRGTRDAVPDGHPKTAGSIPIRMNPMSSWSVVTDEAKHFGVKGSVWVSQVPAARIVALPSTGFGCSSEGEVIVMGGSGQAARISSSSLMIEDWQLAVDGGEPPVYIDEPPDDDWPKRTPDTFEDLGLDAPDEIAAVVAGGPGSGPRPGHKSS